MKKVIKLTESDIIRMVKQVINEKQIISESLSIDIGTENKELKLATPKSKKVLNISKNEKYSKNKHSVITVTNDKGTKFDYLVYLLGKPFNMDSIQPYNNEILIKYFTGDRNEKTNKAITKTKLIKLDKLEDYIPELIKGEKEISSWLDPVKLIKVN
jgi:hypothetical protein